VSCAFQKAVSGIQDELQELQVEVEAGNQDNIEAEFRDVLFS
jgi:XTP/dITP diphosphohydrolase